MTKHVVRPTLGDRLVDLRRSPGSATARAAGSEPIAGSCGWPCRGRGFTTRRDPMRTSVSILAARAGQPSPDAAVHSHPASAVSAPTRPLRRGRGPRAADPVPHERRGRAGGRRGRSRGPAGAVADRTSTRSRLTCGWLPRTPASLRPARRSAGARRVRPSAGFGARARRPTAAAHASRADVGSRRGGAAPPRRGDADVALVGASMGASAIARFVAPPPAAATAARGRRTSRASATRRG